MPEPIMVEAPVVSTIPPAQPAAPAATSAPVTLPATTPAAPAATPAPVATATPPASFDEPPQTAPTPPSQDETVVYEKTGDKSLDVALRFVGQRGFKPEHPAMVAAMKGDFTQLEAAMKTLGAKASGFEDYIDLAKESLSRRQAQALASTEKTNKAVYDAVGGSDKWAAIHAWASANADPAEKAELNAAFKAGGVAATAAARHLADLFGKHGATAPKAVVKPDTAAAAPVTSGPLNSREYAREVSKLSAKLGPKMEDSAEYRQLQARHAASRKS